MNVSINEILEELKQDPEALRKVYAMYILETHQGMLKDKKLRKISDGETLATYASRKGFKS